MSDDRYSPPGAGGPVRAAVILSIVWIAATLGALMLFGGAGLTSFAIVMLSTAVVLPLAVIWSFVFAIRLSAAMADMDARLHASIDALHAEIAALRSGRMAGGAAPDDAALGALVDRLDAIAATQQRMEGALASTPATAPGREATPAALAAREPAPAAPAASEEAPSATPASSEQSPAAARPAPAVVHRGSPPDSVEGSRPEADTPPNGGEGARKDGAMSGRPHDAVATRGPEPGSPGPKAGAAPTSDRATEAEPTGEPELDMADVIAALQFPADPDDSEGFRALRRARKHRRSAQLVTAAQDVLTLLSLDGVYMDDLAPQPAPPAAWRRFAAGDRDALGPELAGIRDAEALDTVGKRLEGDAVFRDAAHHFLRLFDQRLGDLVAGMDDAQIAALMETRTGRAFILLGQKAGTFD